MTAALALYLYRAVFVAFIVYASAKTFVEGWPAPQGATVAANMTMFIRTLAGVEILAALLFLAPAAQLWAGGALLVIFAIATVVDLTHGGVPARFAYYSGTVLILMYLYDRVKPAAQA